MREVERIRKFRRATAIIVCVDVIGIPLHVFSLYRGPVGFSLVTSVLIALAAFGITSLIVLYCVWQNLK